MYLISRGVSCGSPSHGSDTKEFACNSGDLGSIPQSGRFPREGNGYPLQYSCLEKSKDRGAWWATVRPRGRRVRQDYFPMTSLVAQTAKNLPAMWEMWVQSLGREDPLEEDMATHSSMLTWETPWIEEPGGLQSTGSQRVRHYRATNTFTFTFVSIIWKSQIKTNSFR